MSKLSKRLLKRSAVDLFAGAGGMSTGASQAGAHVIWAANHNPMAVEIHARNHPEAAHLCQDLNQVNPALVPAHGLLLAGPDCKGHSQVSQPDRKKKAHVQVRHAAARSTIFAVTTVADYHEPDIVLVENVPDLLRWRVYPSWKAGMEAIGYVITENLLNAADFGVPQLRKRLIISCRLGKKLVIRPERKKHKPAASFIDFDDPDGRWAPVKEKTERVQAQVAEAIKRYGKRCLVHYDSYNKGRDLDRPIGTITTKDQWALVDGKMIRMLTAREYAAAQGFPPDYKLPEKRTVAVRFIGDAVPVGLARGVVKQALAA